MSSSSRRPQRHNQAWHNRALGGYFRGSFVSVVDAGGLTRAGERVPRTQSTASQQIRRLEGTFGRSLLHRDAKRVTPTEGGERLLSYARRILALADEARDVVAPPDRGRCCPARNLRGFRRLSSHGDAVGLRPLASGPAARR